MRYHSCCHDIGEMNKEMDELKAYIKRLEEFARMVGHGDYFWAESLEVLDTRPEGLD